MMDSKHLAAGLWVAIVASAFIVINGTYQSRQKFIAWQDLLKQAQAYEVEWGQLLIEKSTLQSYIGLEKVASDELQMVFPARKQIVIVPGDKP